MAAAIDESNGLSFLAHAPLCVVVLDAENRAVKANATFEEEMGGLFKFKAFEFQDAAAEDDGKALLKGTIDAVRSGGSKKSRCRNVEMLTLAGDGLPIRRHFDWTVGVGPGGGGGGGVATSPPSSLVLFGDPCTDRDVEQRAKDEELVDFFQNAPIALHWLSGTGIVLWANQTELDVLGYTAEEYIGQPIMKFCPDEEELVLEIFKQLGSGNAIRDVPVRFRTKDGRIVDLLIDSNVKYDKQGDFSHTRCFIRDDTKRKVREARARLLLEETKRSLSLLDNFMSRTLHHLRTPLHVMASTCEVVSGKVEELQRLHEAQLILFGPFGGVSGGGLMTAAGQLAAAGTTTTPPPPPQPPTMATVGATAAAAGGSGRSLAIVGAEQSQLLKDSLSLLSDACAEVRSTVGLLDDVADLARCDQGAALKTVVERVDLRELGIAATKAMPRPNPGVKHVFELGGGGPALVGSDGTQLKRVLGQLLSNAAKVTTSGSVTLRIDYSTEGSPPPSSSSSKEKGQEKTTTQWRCTFIVADTGPGLTAATASASRAAATNSTAGAGGAGAGGAVPSGDGSGGSGVETSADTMLPPIFQRYHRELIPEDMLDDAKASKLRDAIEKGIGSRQSNSLGIGLSLSYHIVQALGGELRYDTSPTNGTRFWFALPCSASNQEQLKAEDLVVAMGRCSTSTSTSTSSTDSSGGSAAATAAANIPAKRKEADTTKVGSQKRFQSEDPLYAAQSESVAIRGLDAGMNPHVLVVEDTDVCAKLLCMQLGKLNCSTMRASNGQQAVDMLRGAVPGMYSLILMDLRMPVMDGFEATKILKDEIQVACPIVAVSGESGPDVQTRVGLIGFDGFLPKPLGRGAVEKLLCDYTDFKRV